MRNSYSYDQRNTFFALEGLSGKIWKYEKKFQEAVTNVIAGIVGRTTETASNLWEGLSEFAGNCQPQTIQAPIERGKLGGLESQ